MDISFEQLTKDFGGDVSSRIASNPEKKQHVNVSNLVGIRYRITPIDWSRGRWIYFSVVLEPKV